MVITPGTASRWAGSVVLPSGDPENNCWAWAGPKWLGYGRVVADYPSRLAHRVAFTLFNGPIPDGLCVLHRCDNRECTNPGHLFLGTIRDNNQDMTAKGRHWKKQQTHCPAGHPYSGDNLYYHPKAGRTCRTCHKKHARAHYERQRDAGKSQR